MPVYKEFTETSGVSLVLPIRAGSIVSNSFPPRRAVTGIREISTDGFVPLVNVNG